MRGHYSESLPEMNNSIFENKIPQLKLFGMCLSGSVSYLPTLMKPQPIIKMLLHKSNGVRHENIMPE